ncbi:MAG: hypothetical protein ABJC62_11230, partial [Frankiaceae bacterium]
MWSFAAPVRARRATSRVAKEIVRLRASGYRAARLRVISLARRVVVRGPGSCPAGDQPGGQGDR